MSPISKACRLLTNGNSGQAYESFTHSRPDKRQRHSGTDAVDDANQDVHALARANADGVASFGNLHGHFPPQRNDHTHSNALAYSEHDALPNVKA